MSVKMTLKAVPIELYARLKEAAEQKGCGVDSEIIAALTRHYLPVGLAPNDRLRKVRETRLHRPLRSAAEKSGIPVFQVQPNDPVIPSNRARELG